MYDIGNDGTCSYAARLVVHARLFPVLYGVPRYLIRILLYKLLPPTYGLDFAPISFLKSWTSPVHRLEAPNEKLKTLTCPHSLRSELR